MSPSDAPAKARAVDALLVIPPFAALERPALGPHLLQACARGDGFEVRIVYANLLFAETIGDRLYSRLCYGPLRELIGERFFAAAAYDSPALGRDGDAPELARALSPLLEVSELRRLQASLDGWLDGLVGALLEPECPAIGSSTSFQQTAASIAILRRIKRRRPAVLTMLGGANCEGEMAEGILSIEGGVDLIFSGESEASFTAFLATMRAGGRPAARVIEGRSAVELDRLPVPDFADYYDALDRFLPHAELLTEGDVWLPYESSRGCWWGQKHHCTFCGLNGKTMAFRAKSAGKVVEEIRHLVERHPSNRLTFVDNIMPHGYFSDLLPRLGDELPGLHMFYEQKANLSLSNVVALRRSGVAVIQPGIEALSTPLLKRMDKGVTARQNVALLRYARAVDLSVTWNLLYRIPGDRLDEYEETLALMPLLRHLHPPAGVFPLMIDRFSPYFDRPGDYGVRNLRPWPSYAAILPQHAAVERVAYHFNADYPSDSQANPGVIRAIADEVALWRRAWEAEDGAPPMLTVVPITGDQFLLYDTRGLPDTREVQFLSPEQACAVLAGGPMNAGVVQWALERRLMASLDGRIVPLATATPDLIDEFERGAWRAGA